MARLRSAVSPNAATSTSGSLTDKVRDFLGRHTKYDKQTLNDVIAEYGDNASIATALTGTHDPRSKEYKAAIRSIQKLRHGDIKNPDRSKYAGRLVGLLADRNAISNEQLKRTASSYSGSLTIHVDGFVAIASETDPRLRQFTVHIDGTAHGKGRAVSPAEFLQAALVSPDAGVNTMIQAYCSENGSIYSPTSIDIS